MSATLPCRACKAPIRFVETPAGKKLPVDAQEVHVVLTKGGPLNVVLDDGSVARARATVEGDADHAGTNVTAAWTPHWSTCPHAERFRREKRATAS